MNSREKKKETKKEKKKETKKEREKKKKTITPCCVYDKRRLLRRVVCTMKDL